MAGSRVLGLVVFLLMLIALGPMSGQCLTRRGTLPLGITAIDARGIGYGHQRSPKNRLARVDLATGVVTPGGTVPGSLIHCWATSVARELFCLARRTGGVFSLHRSTNAGNTFAEVLDLRFPDVRTLHRGVAEVRLRGQRTYLLGEYNFAEGRQPGGHKDAVVLWQSRTGTSWQPLYTFNVGRHQTRHIHALTQDPATGWIYLALGDSTTERGLLGWDGVAPWPPAGTPLEAFAARPGFVVALRQFRTMATDLLLPGDGFLYTGQEQTIALGVHDSEKGIWRWDVDRVPAQSTRVLAFAGSGLRLGVVTERGRQVWADAGNIATPTGPGIQLFVSDPDRYDPGHWTIQKAVALNRAIITIPTGLTTWEETVYLAVGTTTYLFTED